MIPEAAVEEDPTLTRVAVSWFREMAAEAEDAINALPESSQPLWFRERKVAL